MADNPNETGAQGISSPVQPYPDLMDESAASEESFIEGRKQSFAWAQLPEHLSAVTSASAADAALFPLRAASLCAEETGRCLPEVETLLADAARQASECGDLRLTLRPLPEEDDMPMVTMENEAYETTRRADIEDYCRDLVKKFAEFYRAVTDRAASFGINIVTDDGEAPNSSSSTANNLGSVFLVAREWARRVTCAAIWASLMTRSNGSDEQNIINSFVQAINELIQYFRNQKASKQALTEKLQAMLANCTEALRIWKELKSLYEEEQAIWKEQDKAQQSQHSGGTRTQMMQNKVKLLEKSIDQMKTEQKRLRDMLREMEKRSRELQQKNGIPEQNQVDDRAGLTESYDKFMTNLWAVLDKISERTDMAKDCIVTANWELFLMQKKMSVMQLRKLTLLNQLQKDEDTADWLTSRMFSYSKHDVDRQKADLIQAIEYYLESRERSSRGLPSGYLNNNPRIKHDFQSIEIKITTVRDEIRAVEMAQKQDSQQFADLVAQCDGDVTQLKRKRDGLISQVENRRAQLDAVRQQGLQLEEQAHGKPMQTAEDIAAEMVATVDVVELKHQHSKLEQDKASMEKEQANLKAQLHRDKQYFKKLSDEYTDLMNRDSRLSDEEAAVKREAMETTLNALRQEHEKETLDALATQHTGGAGEQLLLHEYVQMKERVKLLQRLILRANKKIAYHQRFEGNLDGHLAKAAAKYAQLEAANQTVLDAIAKLRQTDQAGQAKKD